MRPVRGHCPSCGDDDISEDYCNVCGDPLPPYPDVEVPNG